MICFSPDFAKFRRKRARILRKAKSPKAAFKAKDAYAAECADRSAQPGLGRRGRRGEGLHRPVRAQKRLSHPSLVRHVSLPRRRPAGNNAADPGIRISAVFDNGSAYCQGDHLNDAEGWMQSPAFGVIVFVRFFLKAAQPTDASVRPADIPRQARGNMVNGKRIATSAHP